MPKPDDHRDQLGSLEPTDSRTGLELRERLRLHGYVYVPGALERSRVLDLRGAIIEVLRRRDLVRDDTATVNREVPPLRIGSAGFCSCLADVLRIEALHELAHAPVLLELVESILRMRCFPHPRKMFRLGYPYDMNPDDRIPPHQDARYVKGEIDTVTAWIPLGEYPRGHGGLEVRSAPIRKELLPVRANLEGRFGCTVIDAALDNLEWRTAHFRPGDVLLFHSLTVHAGGVNRSERFRISLDCRYSAVEGSISEDQLLPAYSPQVPDWSVLTEGWQQPALVRPPESVAVESSSMPAERSLRRASVLEL